MATETAYVEAVTAQKAQASTTTAHSGSKGWHSKCESAAPPIHRES